jgi:DNA polymerase-3 subunit delta
MNGKLCLICGDDDYLVDSAARERVNQLVPEQDRAFGIEIIDGRKDTADEARRAVDACIESVQTPGFFGSSKVTWLRDATFLTGGGRVSETVAAKEAVEKLTEWLKNGLLDGQVLVITAIKVLRSSVFFKVCQKQGEVEDFGGGFKSWELEKLADQRLDTLLKKAGLAIDGDARTEFLNRAGFDTRFLVQEIEKLRLYVGDRKQVTAEDVREITSIGREAEAWDLLDAFGERNALAALATLKRLSGQKGIGIMLAAMLEKNVRELLVLRDAYDRKWAYGSRGGACGWSNSLPPEAAALLNALPVNPKTLNAWAMKKKLPHALNYTLQELRVARFRILELREKLVSTGLPEMYLLETTLLRIMGNASKAAAPTRPAAVGAR